MKDVFGYLVSLLLFAMVVSGGCAYRCVTVIVYGGCGCRCVTVIVPGGCGYR